MRELGQTVVMVTHDPVAAVYADRVVLLADGRLAGEIVDPTADSVLDRAHAPWGPDAAHHARRLRAHPRRLVATTLAVVFGVAFVAGSLIFGDTARAGTSTRSPGSRPTSTSWSGRVTRR